MAAYGTPHAEANLHLGPITINPVIPSVDTGELSATLSNTYDTNNGLRAAAGANTVDINVTITPTSPGQKRWELVVHTNDSDEPTVTVVVDALVQ